MTSKNDFETKDIVCNAISYSVPYRDYTIKTPFRIRMTSRDLEHILYAYSLKEFVPNMYAVNPKNQNERILITKENYKMTESELFKPKEQILTAEALEELISQAEAATEQEVTPTETECVEVEEDIVVEPVDEIVVEPVDETVDVHESETTDIAQDDLIIDETADSSDIIIDEAVTTEEFEQINNEPAIKNQQSYNNHNHKKHHR